MKCPVRNMIDVFGGKWKLPIICILADETPKRYSTIKRRLGDITNMMLAQSLKELESDGIVHREQYNEIPPRVEYNLTGKGKSVLPVLDQMAKWAAENIQSDSYCDICKKTR